MDASQAENLDLDTRTGWPKSLRVLLDQYPREIWQGHANLGDMAQFWLERHDMFRELGRSLTAATGEFREGLIAPAQFQPWFAPRLQFFLQQLNTHHHIEDHHYFPILRAADARLAQGFDVLDRDHHVIHDEILRAADAANAMLRAMSGDADAVRRAGDDYAGINAKLVAGLVRHLSDEEDLIIPLILDRGEARLGV